MERFTVPQSYLIEILLAALVGGLLVCLAGELLSTVRLEYPHSEPWQNLVYDYIGIYFK